MLFGSKAALRTVPLAASIAVGACFSLCAPVEGPRAGVRPRPSVPAALASKPPTPREPLAAHAPLARGWAALPAVQLVAPFRVFWGVYGRDNQANVVEAQKHGFEIAVGTQTLADYPGKQKENIARYLRSQSVPLPEKPPYFWKVVRRNIRETDTTSAAMLYQDIELGLRAKLAASDAGAAQPSRQRSQSYLHALASWYVMPATWARELVPAIPVGIYGVQPFTRDYWGFVQSRTHEELLARHADDLPLWRAVEPSVDYAVSSVYVFYENPTAPYYIAANVEENVAAEKSLGNKPVYAFVWLRYHPGAGVQQDREVSTEIAEAEAVLPFFAGARGVVLWGYEPRKDGPYYVDLAPFMSMLHQFARLTPKLADARLVLDGGSAFQLWHDKKPLVRKFVRPDGECIVLAIDPYLEAGESRTIDVECSGAAYPVRLHGAHPTVSDVGGARAPAAAGALHPGD